MGSSWNGYYADQASKTMNTTCKKSKDGDHKWKTFGSWPSTWKECQHCKINVYFK